VAFQTNQFYSPISENAFVEKYIEAQKLISPDYVRIAEDAEGHPVGFVFTFPDLMYREGKRLIVKTLARHPDNKWRGLGMHLISEVFSKAKSDGFTTAIHAFMAQAGTSAPVSGHLGSSNYAHYKLYISLI
jgi:GNAT superfamily N-acetyltransferase